MKYYIYLTPRVGSPQYHQFLTFWDYQKSCDCLVNDATLYPAHATLYHNTNLDVISQQFTRLELALPPTSHIQVIDKIRLHNDKKITCFDFTSIISNRIPDVINLHFTLLHNLKCNEQERKQIESKITTTFNLTEWTNEWDITMWSMEGGVWKQLKILHL